MGDESQPAVPAPDASNLARPMLQIDGQLHAQKPGIERWFEGQWRDLPLPFYASVDLRNSGFKVAPIDTNLFPAGFNNLQPAFRPRCVQAIQTEVAKICPTARGVVVIPESHTRNIFYFESLAALVELLALSGLRVRVGSLLPDLSSAQTVELPSGRPLTLEPLVRTGKKVRVGDFEPCFVLLNNDLSAGRPEILEGLEQPVVPPLALGWTNRRKSNHFAHYRRVAQEFAELVKIDPWLIDPLFKNCGNIDFQKREGEECLSANVDALLTEIARKYGEYGIEREPFVIVKADAGTYGMAIMTVKSAAEVRDLNRKQRAKMSRTKEGQTVTEVLVQEGVYTAETRGDPPASAEPVIYMIGPSVVGGFYRVHTTQGPTENLNTPGMHFEPLACPEPGHPDESRFYAYGVVARLALLAAARELKEVS
jgi:glutamate--cysteine ligase